MPKIVNYDEKKHEIAENAINVFIKNGYHKTKLSDIAKNVAWVELHYINILKIKMRYLVL